MISLWLKNKWFGWQYATFVWKPHCSGQREIKRIKKISNGDYVARTHNALPHTLRTLEPRGRFNHQDSDFMQDWEPITEELRQFYESEPPRPVGTPMNQSLVNFDNLSPAIIDYIVERYKLQRKENKPKTTQQVYTGKRLIQL